MRSIYDEPEGRVDGMMSYQACHLCHNANKKCERPPAGGQCKRCANTYIHRPWVDYEERLHFFDGRISDHVYKLLRCSPQPGLSLFEDHGVCHSLTISANKCESQICIPSHIRFRGPFRYDNILLGPEFDKIVSRDFSTPRVEASKDPNELVSLACLAGGYMNLFFCVDAIVDQSDRPVDPRTLWLGLSNFILGRLARHVERIMSAAQAHPMTRNARLSLAALHVAVNRVKISTSKLQHLRILYDDEELSLLLKDWIHYFEAELRHLFQTDCGLIKDWGAPLESGRKEFKNTTRSFDPLTLTIKVDSWHELAGSDTYASTLSAPSDSGDPSSVAVSSLNGSILKLQHAGVEDKYATELDDGASDRPAAGSSISSALSSIDCAETSMEHLPLYFGDRNCLLEDLYGNSQALTESISSGSSAFNKSSVDDDQIDWNLFIDSDQMIDDKYQEKDLGSPMSWDSDPGESAGCS